MDSNAIPQPISPMAIRILSFGRKALHRLGLRRQGHLGVMPYLPTHFQGQEAGDAIRQIIEQGRPAMIARFGVGELHATIRYASLQRRSFRVLDFLSGYGEPGWWTEDLKSGMPVYNGFFPATEENLNRFGALMMADIQTLDLLGSWQRAETFFEQELRQILKIPLADLEPYFHIRPWSSALAGKKVLVVHPFEQSIRRQYTCREKLFQNPEVLPNFELKTLKAVQSIAGETGGFTSWFHALEYMKDQMSSTDFEVAIIGCGAYGFPLAAHAKRLGKIGIHLGGATQILFGIRGARWDTDPLFTPLFNEFWVRPLPEETPPQAEKVEGGCYW